MSNRVNPWGEISKTFDRKDTSPQDNRGDTSQNSIPSNFSWYKNLLNNPLRSMPSRGFKKEKKQSLKPSFKV